MPKESLGEMAERCTADIASQIPMRPGPGGKTRRSGAPSLAFMRGHQAGVGDAYKAVRKRFPDAAAAILKKFGMNEDGDICIG